MSVSQPRKLIQLENSTGKDKKTPHFPHNQLWSLTLSSPDPSILPEAWTRGWSKLLGWRSGKGFFFGWNSAWPELMSSERQVVPSPCTKLIPGSPWSSVLASPWGLQRLQKRQHRGGLPSLALPDAPLADAVCHIYIYNDNLGALTNQGSKGIRYWKAFDIGTVHIWQHQCKMNIEGKPSACTEQGRKDYCMNKENSEGIMWTWGFRSWKELY